MEQSGIKKESANFTCTSTEKQPTTKAVNIFVAVKTQREKSGTQKGSSCS